MYRSKSKQAIVLLILQLREYDQKYPVNLYLRRRSSFILLRHRILYFPVRIVKSPLLDGKKELTNWFRDYEG